MSIRVTAWALNEAPTEEPVQVLILIALAEKANDDGTVSYPSMGTIATKARVSVRTVQREMKKLEALGLIVRGDQNHVNHLRANHRPVVWNLNVSARRGDNLSPQDLGVTNTASRGDTAESRGDIHDSLGVTLMADNTSLDSSPITSPVTTAADAAEEVLFDLPAPVKKRNVAQEVAIQLVDDTGRFWTYAPVYGIVEFAISQGYSPRQVYDAMLSMWKNGRGLSKALLGQILQGVVKPGQSQFRKPSTDDRVMAGMALAEMYDRAEAQREIAQ